MNLLTDPLITIRWADVHERLAVPEVLAVLLRDDAVQAFPRLTAEQRSHWWRFLVRCAARALRTAGVSPAELTRVDREELARRVRRGLLEHTQLGDWELFQADPAKAGFLQPPTPGHSPPRADKYRSDSAALLTSVIGTKEHERKSQVGRVLDAESLVYALVEYQGGVIFGGRGNYESQLTGSRSGAGSGTPFMGVLIDGSLGKTFRHDVRVMHEGWGKVSEHLTGDLWALWTERWDGTTPTPAARLDPAFIPCARMIRVGEPVDDRFDTVWFRASSASRVADHTQGGDLGDPFTPLVPDPRKGHLKVRGTLEKGYDYKEVVRLLLPRDASDAITSPSVRTALLDPPEGEDLRVVFEGMAFEQGKTRGFHRRVVRLPKKAVSGGLLYQRRDAVHSTHEQMLRATESAKRALRAALAIVLTGAPRARDEVREKMVTAMARVEDEVDRRYIEFLFEAAVAGGTDPTLPYREFLFHSLTRIIFPEALGSLPRSQGRRWEEEVSAEAYLRGRLRKDLTLPAPEPAEEAAV